MKKQNWITAVAVLTLGTSLALAGPGGGRGKGGHDKGKGRHEAKFAEKLNLTEAQKNQIHQIRQNNRAENQDFYESSKQTRQEARAAKQANDTARLEALKGQMQSQREQMKRLRQTEMAQINAILTPEQKARFAAMKAEHQGRRKNHRN